MSELNLCLFGKYAVNPKDVSLVSEAQGMDGKTYVCIVLANSHVVQLAVQDGFTFARVCRELRGFKQ